MMWILFSFLCGFAWVKELINHWQTDTFFSSCERRYEIEHHNFGSFSKHFLCPSRKHCSVSILLLTSDITRPNEGVPILCRYKDSIPFSSINGEEPCSSVMSSFSKSSMRKPCDDSVENGQIVNIYFDSPLLAFQ